MSQINKNHIGTKFDDFMMEVLRDESTALEYLNQAAEQFFIDDNKELYREALKKVIKARCEGDFENEHLSDLEKKKRYDQSLGETLIEAITNVIDNMELISIIKKREGEEYIEVNIDDL